MLGVSGSGAVERCLASHRDYIMAETLAIEWQTGQPDPLYSDDRELGDDRWTIEFGKA